MSELENVDPEVYKFTRDEIGRQQNTLGMIASENYCSKAVLEAQGSVLQNKYSEGYPGKRYYAGNEIVDSVEVVAIERAKKLFGEEHANVQPHAGSPANIAAYVALLQLGEKIMSLGLEQGGHLTHGSPVNFSGKAYKIAHYHLHRGTHVLDYDEIEKRAKEEKPDLLLCGYTAYPRAIDFKRFREIADMADAYLMADISHIAGLVVGGAHESPIPHADVTTTTTHKTLRGPRGAIILCKNEYAKEIDKSVFPGLQGGPFEHAIAAKAVCFKEAMTLEFREYAKQIVRNAKTLADALIDKELELVSGGTDNHLILIDLSKKGITGKQAQFSLERAGIVCNRNMVPYDKQSPFITSGIRIGTPMMTTRGMGESEMKHVAELIVRVLNHVENAEIENKVLHEVVELCKKFPIYKSL